VIAAGHPGRSGCCLAPLTTAHRPVQWRPSRNTGRQSVGTSKAPRRRAARFGRAQLPTHHDLVPESTNLVPRTAASNGCTGCIMLRSQRKLRILRLLQYYCWVFPQFRWTSRSP